MQSAVASARAHSSQALGADLAERQAQAAYRQAQRGLGPSLSAVALYSDSDDPGLQQHDANQAGLHLGFDGLPWGSTAASANVEMGRWRQAAVQRELDFQDLDYRVRVSYLSVLEARSNQEAVEKVRNKITDELQRYLPGFQAGGGPVLEQVKIQAFVAALEGQWGQARLQALANEDEFRRLLDLADDEPLELEAVTDAGQAWETADLGQDSPQLQVLRAAVLIQESQLQLSSLKRLPNLELGADYGYSGRVWHEQAMGWGVKLGLSLPIWDWGRLSAEKDQASAQWALAKVHEKEGQQRGRAELRQLQRQIRVMQEDQKRLEALLPRLEAAATASARRYRLASLTLLDVTDIYSQWLQTLQAERSDHYDRLEAVARLAQLSGRPFEAVDAP